MKLQTNSVPHCNLMDSEMLQAMQLPYADNNITMTITLPKLCDIVDQLTVTNSDLFQVLTSVLMVNTPPDQCHHCLTKIHVVR